jgi:hypothetical protein
MTLVPIGTKAVKSLSKLAKIKKAVGKASKVAAFGGASAGAGAAMAVKENKVKKEIKDLKAYVFNARKELEKQDISPQKKLKLKSAISIAEAKISDLEE